MLSMAAHKWLTASLNNIDTSAECCGCHARRRRAFRDRPRSAPSRGGRGPPAPSTIRRTALPNRISVDRPGRGAKPPVLVLAGASRCRSAQFHRIGPCRARDRVQGRSVGPCNFAVDVPTLDTTPFGQGAFDRRATSFSAWSAPQADAAIQASRRFVSRSRLTPSKDL